MSVAPDVDRQPGSSTCVRDRRGRPSACTGVAQPSVAAIPSSPSALAGGEAPPSNRPAVGRAATVMGRRV